MLGVSYGGDGGWYIDSIDFFYLFKLYDRNNIVFLLGGSGGEIIMIFIWSRKNYLNNYNIVM